MESLKEEIFFLYCKASADMMDPSDGVLSSIATAKHFNISKYMARKVIHDLVEEGLLRKTHYGGLSDWDWQVHCYHGYSITNKARNTWTYKKALYREAKICAECFGGHMISYYRSMRPKSA